MSTGSVLIKNGIVVDPANGIDQEPLSVLLQNGLIASVSPDIPQQSLPNGCEVFDASGCLVCPGLIDMHVHCFPGGSSLGVDPDEHCLSRGVTTVVDAGSAGCKRFKDFEQYKETKKIRMFCFLHASQVGLETAGCAQDNLLGELNNIDDVNTDRCLECISSNKETVVGIKIRLTAKIANDGKNEREAFRRALSISSQADLPLMVHYVSSTIPHDGEKHDDLGVPSSLRKGDILTHLYHGFKSTILDVPAKDACNLTIHPSIKEARERGVWLDVGHGLGSFVWAVAETAAREGVWPDTISTDLHNLSVNGPAYDLTTVMTKLLHVGMPLYEIIKAVTHNPARIIKMENSTGSLSRGTAGDVTVLKIVDCSVMMEDSRMETRHLTKKILPVATWLGGERIDIKELAVEWPNREKDHVARLLKRDGLMVEELKLKQ